ncbi:DUF4112 domain-containing protein [Alcanivorax sp. 1008]|uniref:DUF4112 domain-containing protein n=1 Tax=Alcanivorax sp. 1008 TaxID=2816853 RepID=UPI001DFD5203|nr:DUF4112 domain-containing protein [Alcanivorax sp. 1008]MCC1497403.1 DUF4112 domain-containing protein [Alcanivorax sp. 1008]
MSKRKEHEYRQALARLDKYSKMTDSQFSIPFTGIRFGVDPILGLLPVIGDFIGLLLSLPVLIEANRIGAPAELKRKMIRNMIIEAVMGVVPVVGDVFDIYWKANTRNTALLRGWIKSHIVPEKTTEPKEWLMIVVLGLLLVALLAWLIL